jgi:hypothetical protein
MPTVYNAAYIATSPASGSFEHAVSGLTTDNPGDPASRLGGHDYAMHVICDLNAILVDFQLHRNLSTNTMSTHGEAEAWRQLHGVLNAGQAPNGAGVTSFRTIYKDGDETTTPSWLGLFAGAISTAINPRDLDGLSVKRDTLQTTLDDRDGGPETNDVIGVLHGAFSHSFGGEEGLELSLEAAPSPSSHYLAAVALFLHSLRGATTGQEGSLTGDPSDGFVSLALKSGDGLGLRMLVRALGAVSVLLLLEQS